MANYAKTSVADGPRAVLHDEIGLTGCGSEHKRPARGARAYLSFTRTSERGDLRHTRRLGQSGDRRRHHRAQSGDWLRIAPSAKRRFFAADDEAIKYVCIQVKEGSLEQHTADDAVV